MDLKCAYCDGDLDVLQDTHSEYRSTRLTYDGTRKWYLCSSCEAVWCLDKITRRWKLSPETYTRFVKEGKIPDKLV